MIHVEINMLYINKKKHDIVALDEGVFYINTQQEKADDKHHFKKKAIMFTYNTLEKGVHLSKTQYNNQNNGTIQC